MVHWAWLILAFAVGVWMGATLICCLVAGRELQEPERRARAQAEEMSADPWWWS